MIFVTVGSQMPFDRMVKAVDDWAARSGRSDIFAQIGPTDWRPRHISWTCFMDPIQFRQKVREVDIIVAHAGTGTIISALEMSKPLLIMPRRADLRETRTDHQVATVRQFLRLGLVEAAFDEHELVQKLDQLEKLSVSKHVRFHASEQLLSAVRSFINE